MSEVSRRSFLGSAAGASAVAMGAPLFAQDGMPSEKVTVGVMGLSRGRALAIGFAKQENVNVKYVCDVDLSRAGAAVAQVEKDAGQVPEAVGDYRTMLDDPDLDVLVCAAPNHWHAPATILGCKAGKHVYCEKPASHNGWEGETMVKAARKYDRAVQIGTQRRSSEAFIEAITKLHGGVIGKVYCARAWYNNARQSIGIGQPAEVPGNLNYELWQGPAPRVPYYDNRLPYNWHWLWHWGGGELANNGVHSLDICRWGLDVDYPIKVVSTGGRYRYEDDQQTPDTNTVTFEFPGGKQMCWMGLSCNRHSESSGFVTFYGEKGALEITGNGSYKIFDANNKVIDEATGSIPVERHIANFVAAIRSGKHQDLNADVEIGVKSTQLCNLGNIAYKTASALQCNAETGHPIGNERATALWKREYEPGWEPTL